MPCTVCQHPQRQDIDQALMSGGTLAALSQQYNLSTSALHRHKAHLQAKVGWAKSNLLDYLQQGFLFWLSQALEMSMQTAQAAQAEGNAKVALQAIAQGTRLINIMMKHDLPLDDRLVYEILASPQWTTQASLLPHDPKIMSMSRQSLAGALSSPCPETAAPASSPASPVDPDLMQQLLQGLAQPMANGKRKTENGLFKPREKSGKLPGKTFLNKNNIKKYQEDILVEKSAGKSDQSCPSGFLLEELDAGRLDFDYLNAIGAGRRFPEPQTVFQEVLSPVTPEFLGKVC